ncbi:hypothetical protein SARC_10270 [Sphaeroforma arctica JP610]|uniref:Uncharacterized protein n=1 Tax=Sphaeroforma arctica JP610 TaxID=667725 RepID=A0A0L0FML1_9EUKA|nr:hypothetical protein SARC_10270 [Sphaeroforma arctica JP610]KNC77268.1 hypothetical protein SARC_10270 [Sphaeroforma arctica JP610]|eukprot:XP_014151170.1 hypothetical protein SARC_10270 [Sphaeroforma arctica JP610]
MTSIRRAFNSKSKDVQVPVGVDPVGRSIPEKVKSGRRVDDARTSMLQQFIRQFTPDRGSTSESQQKRSSSTRRISLKGRRGRSIHASREKVSGQPHTLEETMIDSDSTLKVIESLPKEVLLDKNRRKSFRDRIRSKSLYVKLPLEKKSSTPTKTTNSFINQTVTSAKTVEPSWVQNGIEAKKVKNVTTKVSKHDRVCKESPYATKGEQVYIVKLSGEDRKPKATAISTQAEIHLLKAYSSSSLLGSHAKPNMYNSSSLGGSLCSIDHFRIDSIQSPQRTRTDVNRSTRASAPMTLRPIARSNVLRSRSFRNPKATAISTQAEIHLLKAYSSSSLLDSHAKPNMYNSSSLGGSLCSIDHFRLDSIQSPQRTQTDVNCSTRASAPMTLRPIARSNVLRSRSFTGVSTSSDHSGADIPVDSFKIQRRPVTQLEKSASRNTSLEKERPVAASRPLVPDRFVFDEGIATPQIYPRLKKNSESTTHVSILSHDSLISNNTRSQPAKGTKVRINTSIAEVQTYGPQEYDRSASLHIKDTPGIEIYLELMKFKIDEMLVDPASKCNNNYHLASASGTHKTTLINMLADLQ